MEKSYILAFPLDLLVMDSDGSNKRLLLRNGATNFAPSWHPNGRRIIFASNKDDWREDIRQYGHNFELYLINIDGTGLERITYNTTSIPSPCSHPTEGSWSGLRTGTPTSRGRRISTSLTGRTRTCCGTGKGPRGPQGRFQDRGRAASSRPTREGWARSRAGRRALRIASIYGFCGFLWIMLSDRLLAALIQDSAMLTRLQTYKGWAFILITATLVFVLSRGLSCNRATGRRGSGVGEPDAQHHRIHSRRHAPLSPGVRWPTDLHRS